MIEIIKNIQRAKANQATYLQKPIEERIAWLERIANSIEEKSNDYAKAELFDLDSNMNYSIKPAIQSFRRAANEIRSQFDELAQPVGLITIILPAVMSLRALAERVAPALAAGNCVMIKASSKNPMPAKIFKQTLDEVKFPSDICQVVYGSGSEVGSLLASHPSVRAVSLCGSLNTIQNVLKTPNIFLKKIQCASGGSNSAILIGETWSKEQMNVLARACFSAGGGLPWNISKIFVSEVSSKKFVEEFVDIAKTFKISNKSENAQKIIETIKYEDGKILCGDGHSATVVLDLSHCSALQQEGLLSPIVLISTVKYQHDAIKWANTGYLGLAALLIGNEEKSYRAALKLDCGHVWINTWLGNKDGVIVGTKQSSFGVNDYTTFGSFYSDRKKIVTETSII